MSTVIRDCVAHLLHRAIGLHIVTARRDDGAELRFLRKQLRLTQEALAQRLRVNVQTVANYEKGKTAMACGGDSRCVRMYALPRPAAGGAGEPRSRFVDGIMASRPETTLLASDALGEAD